MMHIQAFRIRSLSVTCAIRLVGGIDEVKALVDEPLQQRAPIKLQTLELIKQRKIPFETILDVGVLTGTPELIEAFPDKLHILFEPVVEFNDAIKVAYEGVPHILVNCAVSHESGEVALGVRSAIVDTEISHSSMITGNSTPDEKTRIVPMVSLDDYLVSQPVGGPYLLKIDIDGHEMSVIRGAKSCLRACSIVIIETPVYEFTTRIQALEDAGFELLDLSEPCYYDKAFWQCDAIMIRREMRDRFFLNISAGLDLGKYEVYRG